MTPRGFTVPIRRPGEANDAAPGQRDLQEQIGRPFGRVLSVSATMPTSTTGVRLFRIDDPSTDQIEFVAGADNVIPHGLGVPVNEVYLTQVGGSPVALAWSVKDPTTVAGLPAGLDATKVVCVRVTASVTARVRAVP